MARDLNKIMVIGRLGADPEMRFTADGTPVTTFRMAVNRPMAPTAAGGMDGDRREVADWFRVVAWRKLAENCNQYLAKGHRVYVEGRVQIQQWQDREGQTRYSTEIVANDVIFLERPAAVPMGPAGHDDGMEAGDIDADDLPF